MAVAALTKVVPALIALLLMMLFVVRRLHSQTSTPAIFLATCAAFAILGLGIYTPASENISTLPAAAVVAFLAAYILLRTAESYLSLSLPSRLASLRMLFRERLKARSAGLAILRGCCLGAAYLAVHTAIIGLLGLYGKAGPDTFWLMFTVELLRVSENGLNLIAVSLAVLGSILLAWCFLVFPAALAWRTRPNAAAVIAVPTIVWLIGTLSLPGASAFPLFPQFLIAGLQGALFAWILYRFDALTVMAAMFTVEMWLLIYPMFVLLRDVETSAWLTTLPWFVIVIAGLTIYLRPRITAAGRAVAEVMGSSSG